MKISGVDIRPGNIIEYEGGIWKVAKIQHTQPGKGGAYMQVEMKNLIDGRKNNVRFRSAETVEKVSAAFPEAVVRSAVRRGCILWARVGSQTEGGRALNARSSMSDLDPLWVLFSDPLAQLSAVSSGRIGLLFKSLRRLSSAQSAEIRTSHLGTLSHTT